MSITRSEFLKVFVGGIAMSVGLSACGQGQGGASDATSPDGNGKKVALVLTTSGLGDQGFNDLAYEGMQRAQSKLGIDFDYAEPSQLTDYEPIIRDLTSSGEYSVIIGIGFSQSDALKAAAADNPDQQYAFIDGSIDLPNVASYACKEQEGSFLVGALAAYMKQDNAAYGLQDNHTYGFVGAVQSAQIDKFAAGYQAGVRYVDADAVVQIRYVGGDNPYADTTTAKEIATSEFGSGADIIYHAAGGSGQGVFTAAKESGFVAIGCNSNQNNLDPDHIVASMLKKVDVASFNIVEAASKGELKVGEATILSVADDGVGYTTDGSNIKVSEDILKKVDDIRQKIISGEIDVPSSL